MTAETLSRGRAVIGRYGGDEFIALLPGAGRDRAERYKQGVEESLEALGVVDDSSGSTIPVRASIGIAIYPDDAGTVATLIEFAERDMDAQKHARQAERPQEHAA